MRYSLLPLSTPQLQALAASQVPADLAGRAQAGAWPPAFVAARSLGFAAQGHRAPWTTPFLIVDAQGDRIVGGCGFKTVPRKGRVEVGYAVAPLAQGQGAATAALELLVCTAFGGAVRGHSAVVVGDGVDRVDEVVAEVAPTNLASTRVVSKAGFVPMGERMDPDREHVIQWVKRRAA